MAREKATEGAVLAFPLPLSAYWAWAESDVLAYIKARADSLPEGSWISVRQIFVTRA